MRLQARPARSPCGVRLGSLRHHLGHRVQPLLQPRRHGRTSRAKTCNGGTEPLALALDRTVTREVVVRPAHEPAQAAVAGLAEA